jgi:D-glycero-alpha-D-manno-heptose-7-phosphate kinase
VAGLLKDDMVISKTPLRVSFAGGGTDFAEYYRVRRGRVVSMAIGRHMYVTVNRRFDDAIRVAYTRTETVEHVDDLRHDLIREAMKMTGITKGVEISTIADVPAGSGLGSSSSLAVGVLNALYAFQGRYVDSAVLARQACELEIDILGRPIGKQDQYIAAFGGFQFLHFNTDDTVSVEPVVCSTATRRRLVDSLLLFYTGISRESGSVLTEAKERMRAPGAARSALDGLNDLAAEIGRDLAGGRVARFGSLLHKGWLLKKHMASNVTNGELDRYYRLALRAGALGGKISGAGGGGCLLLFAPPKSHASIRKMAARHGLREFALDLEPDGSKIIYAAHS